MPLVSFTQDPAVLFALAITPAILIIIFISSRDQFDKEPPLFLALCFLLGVLSMRPTLYVELELQKISNELFATNPQSVWAVAFDAFIGIAFVEEFFKYLFWMPLLLIPRFRKAFNEPFDGIMYSVMVSMGFATLENLMYIKSGGSEAGFTLALKRMLTAVPAHATFGILMGYFIGLAQMRPKSNLPVYHLIGLITAIAFHGFYDFCLFLQARPSSPHESWSMLANYALIFGAIGSLAVGIQLSLKAIRIHREISPFKHQIEKDFSPPATNPQSNDSKEVSADKGEDFKS